MLIYAIILIAMMLLGNNEKFNTFKQKLSLQRLFGRRRRKEEV